LADSHAATRGDDSAAELVMNMLFPFLWSAFIVIDARHLRRVVISEVSASRDGKHCPHCGSDIGVLAIAMNYSKIRCPYCRSQLKYEGTMGVNLAMGGTLLLLTVLYMWLTWPSQFWRGQGRAELFLLLLLVVAVGEFSSAYYLRAKRVLVLSAPPLEKRDACASQ
jgi:DNA-directed RNA polymerase subunit RPC12/RpoP